MDRIDDLGLVTPEDVAPNLLHGMTGPDLKTRRDLQITVLRTASDGKSLPEDAIATPVDRILSELTLLGAQISRHEVSLPQ